MSAYFEQLKRRRIAPAQNGSPLPKSVPTSMSRFALCICTEASVAKLVTEIVHTFARHRVLSLSQRGT